MTNMMQINMTINQGDEHNTWSIDTADVDLTFHVDGSLTIKPQGGVWKETVSAGYAFG